MAQYLNTIYDTKLRPYTDYPTKLARHLIEMLAIPAGAKMLDVGCGRGEFTKAFENEGLVVEGADIEAGDTAVLNTIPVKYFDLEKEPFPYPDNTFDVVFSKSVIEHIYDPAHFLSEQKRILKPGGKIIVLTPDWMTQLKIFWNDYTHKRPYTWLGLRHALVSFGFTNVTCKVFYQYPFYWKYPFLTFIAKVFQLAGPVKKLYKNKFYRWSRELMVIGVGTK